MKSHHFPHGNWLEFLGSKDPAVKTAKFQDLGQGNSSIDCDTTPRGGRQFWMLLVGFGCRGPGVSLSLVLCSWRLRTLRNCRMVGFSCRLKSEFTSRIFNWPQFIGDFWWFIGDLWVIYDDWLVIFPCGFGFIKLGQLKDSLEVRAAFPGTAGDLSQRRPGMDQSAPMPFRFLVKFGHWTTACSMGTHRYAIQIYMHISLYIYIYMIIHHTDIHHIHVYIYI